jgi:uncharacterized protein (TIGR02598 family)
MKGRTMRVGGFSLVEVTLALGIAAVCLLAVFGLLPVAMQSNQAAAADAAASSIAAAVACDIRATPPSSSVSAQYGVSHGTDKTLYFNQEGEFTSAPTATSRYRADVAFPPNSSGTSGAKFATIKITWPATAAPANAAGSAQVFVAFDRL